MKEAIKYVQKKVKVLWIEPNVFRKHSVSAHKSGSTSDHQWNLDIALIIKRKQVTLPLLNDFAKGTGKVF